MITRRRTDWGKLFPVILKISSIKDLGDSTIRKRNGSGLPIGSGRSYGDCGMNVAGINWTSDDLDSIEISIDDRTAKCGSGVTIGELERRALAAGLHPPVVPGTEFVTIGGAIASNIHGKSHHKRGAFCDHVNEMSLVDYQNETHVLRPEGPTSSIFWATAGGMGLTGVVVSATIRLDPVETQFLSVREVRTSSLSETLSTLKHFDSEHLYSVAWLDFSGKFNGRGIVSGADHTKASEICRLRRRKIRTTQLISRSLPNPLPKWVLSRRSIFVFNKLWFRRRLKSGPQRIRKFLHPLDSVRNWNSIYERTGVVQYQFVVPFEAEDFLYEALGAFKSIKANSFLTVLKRMGAASNGFLSFPQPGWTLAVDLLANTPNLNSTLEQLDHELVLRGGRVYLAKDSRMSKSTFQAMYPDVADWKKIKNQIDPNNYWVSEQGTRLGLC